MGYLRLLVGSLGWDLKRASPLEELVAEGQDIGNPDVIATIAAKSGLDAKETLAAVNDGRYATRLDEARREGQLIGLTGVPLFIVNNKYKIVGAQPIEVFRNLLDKMK